VASQRGPAKGDRPEGCGEAVGEKGEMTIDERNERLEQVTAAHIVQVRKDYEENRRS